LYTSCVLDCALRFLMIFLLLIKKKKEIHALSQLLSQLGGSMKHKDLANQSLH
jgi:hypothetical protein